MEPAPPLGQIPGLPAPPGTDMTSISFRDQLWLNSFPLDRALVFDYFALSPFYDRTCSNEQLRLRSIHPLDASQLKTMVGIEYILHEAQEPHLFVIRKQKRDGPEKVTVLSAFYVLDGSIYQAPQMYGVVASRAVRALYLITKSFSIAASKLEKIGNETDNATLKPEDAAGDGKKAADKAVDFKEVVRVDQILAGVLRRLPPAPPPPPFAITPLLDSSQAGQPPQPSGDTLGGTASEMGPPNKKMKI